MCPVGLVPVAVATGAPGRVAGSTRATGGGCARRSGRVPGELRSVEGVLLPVAVRLSCTVVERERVQRSAVERDLLRTVGVLDRGEVAGHLARSGRRLPRRDGQRRPDRLTGAAVAERHALLLVTGERVRPAEVASTSPPRRRGRSQSCPTLSRSRRPRTLRRCCRPNRTRQEAAVPPRQRLRLPRLDRPGG